MRIAMYGGTFNPIHRGHMQAAQAVVTALSLDKLLLMPAGIPPHKVLPEGSATVNSPSLRNHARVISGSNSRMAWSANAASSP